MLHRISKDTMYDSIFAVCKKSFSQQVKLSLKQVIDIFVQQKTNSFHGVKQFFVSKWYMYTCSHLFLFVLNV